MFASPRTPKTWVTPWPASCRPMASCRSIDVSSGKRQEYHVGQAGRSAHREGRIKACVNQDRPRSLRDELRETAHVAVQVPDDDGICPEGVAQPGDFRPLKERDTRVHSLGPQLAVLGAGR